MIRVTFDRVKGGTVRAVLSIYCRCIDLTMIHLHTKLGKKIGQETRPASQTQADPVREGIFILTSVLPQEDAWNARGRFYAYIGASDMMCALVIFFCKREIVLPR